MTVAAAAAAWLGGSVVLLSDGRRGLAAGLAVLAAGVAALALLADHPVEAVAILAGGLVAAALRFRSGPAGWGVMPAGSTPRLILSIVSGLVALWLAAAVTGGGDGAGLRFSVVAVLTVLVLRVLLGADPAAAATAASGIALALGAGTLLAPGGASDAACLVAGVVAVAMQALPRAEAHGA